MEQIITEKTYPIRVIWLFERIPVLIVISAYLVFVFGFGNGIPIASAFISVFVLVLVLGIPVIITALQRSRFHWSLDEKFMTLHQGIISKQNKNVPYGVIQDVFIHQGLLDRIFGLASITFEDMSQGGQSSMDVDGYVGGGKSRYEALGFVGNKVHIPGLKKADAEALKAILLQKMQEHSADTSSGL